MYQVFLNQEQASDFLSRKDVFLTNLSPFDMSARIKTGKKVSLEEFIVCISRQSLNWSDMEIQELTKVFEEVRGELERYSMQFPDEIYFIKTTGKEEGAAAYCRSNGIIIPQLLLANERGLKRLVTHEMFHIYTRNNPHERKNLYGVIGFKECPELEFPSELIDFKITNPDAPFNNSYITVSMNSASMDLMPILFSDQPYDPVRGGEFFDYMQFRLLAVEKTRKSCRPIYYYKVDELMLFKPEQVPDYLKQIGFNTNYIIHPEEILADNFTLLLKGEVSVPSSWVLEGMKQILK